MSRGVVLTRGRGTEPIPDGEERLRSLSDGTKLFATMMSSGENEHLPSQHPALA